VNKQIRSRKDGSHRCHHGVAQVPQLSANGREDIGRKADTTEKETSGIGSSQSEPNKKEGARDCGEESERVEDKKGIAY
jgi:hypothetical protein